MHTHRSASPERRRTTGNAIEGRHVSRRPKNRSASQSLQDRSTAPISRLLPSVPFGTSRDKRRAQDAQEARRRSAHAVTPKAPLHDRARRAHSPAERPPTGWQRAAVAPQARPSRALPPHRGTGRRPTIRRWPTRPTRSTPSRRRAAPSTPPIDSSSPAPTLRDATRDGSAPSRAACTRSSPDLGRTTPVSSTERAS